MMLVVAERNDWERRYAQSLAHERGRIRDSNRVTKGEIAIEAVGCLFPCVGLVGAAVAGVCVVVRRVIGKVTSRPW